MAVVLRQLVTNLMPSVSGGAYQDARKVSLVWNDIQNIDACLNSEAERTKRVQALFSPLSFLLREKRWGRRRHEAAANLQQPLRRCAPAPLEGEPSGHAIQFSMTCPPVTGIA